MDFVIINKDDYLDYPVIPCPLIHLIGFNEFSDLFFEFLNHNHRQDELYINLDKSIIEDFLDGLFKMKNPKQQFYMDGVRSDLFYQGKSYIGEPNLLYKTLKKKFSKLIFKNIIALATQGSFAFLMQMVQGMLSDKYKNVFFGEKDRKYNTRLTIEIYKNKKFSYVFLKKPMRIVSIGHGGTINTLYSLKCIIEYKIDNITNEINSLVNLQLQ